MSTSCSLKRQCSMMQALLHQCRHLPCQILFQWSFLTSQYQDHQSLFQPSLLTSQYRTHQSPLHRRILLPCQVTLITIQWSTLIHIFYTAFILLNASSRDEDDYDDFQSDVPFFGRYYDPAKRPQQFKRPPPQSQPGAPPITEPTRCAVCHRNVIARMCKRGVNAGRWFVNCPNANSQHGPDDRCNRMSFRWLS